MATNQEILDLSKHTEPVDRRYLAYFESEVLSSKVSPMAVGCDQIFDVAISILYSEPELHVLKYLILFYQARALP